MNLYDFHGDKVVAAYSEKDRTESREARRRSYT